MKLLITIVSRGKGELVCKELNKFKTSYSIVFLGEGTASNQIMEYFSLTNKEKDVVFSIVHGDDEKAILDKLEERFKLSEKKIGMALTLPLASINRMALDEIIGGADKNE